MLVNVAMKHRSGGRDWTGPRGRWTTARAWLAALALPLWGVTPGCVEPEVLALQHDVYEVDGGVETSVVSGCDELPRDPGAAFGFALGPAPGIRPVAYTVRYEFQNDTASMSAGAAEGEPVRREYDEVFLSSGEEDEFFVALSDDFGLRVVNRGVPGGCGPSN
jgi:hypothetical protein